MIDIFKYQCVEIWTESCRFYKKIHHDEHSKGGVEVEIDAGEFYKIKNFFEEIER